MLQQGYFIISWWIVVNSIDNRKDGMRVECRQYSKVAEVVDAQQAEKFRFIRLLNRRNFLIAGSNPALANAEIFLIFTRETKKQKISANR